MAYAQGKPFEAGVDEPVLEEIAEEPEDAQEPSLAGGDNDAQASDYSGEYDEDPLHQISQLLLTEDGEAVADVLQGIRDALDKQNKILFKLAGILEAGRR